MHKFAIVTETKEILVLIHSWLQTSFTSEIIFSIAKTIDKTNRNNNIYFEINNELSDFKNDNIHQQISEGDTPRETSTDGRDRQQHRNDRRVSKKPRFLSR